VRDRVGPADRHRRRMAGFVLLLVPAHKHLTVWDRIANLLPRETAAAACQHNAFQITRSTIPRAGNGLFAQSTIEPGHVCCYFDGRDVVDQAELSGFEDYGEHDPQKIRPCRHGCSCARAAMAGLNFDRTAEEDQPGVRFGVREPRDNCGVVSLSLYWPVPCLNLNRSCLAPPILHGR
jgi:hypothetical protein